MFEHIALALEHGFEGIEQMRDEALFAPLRADPRFAAMLGGAPAAKKKSAAKKKTAKKK